MAIIFIYKRKEYKMDIENDNSINKIIAKFLSIINETENNVIFLYKGKKLSFNFENILNKLVQNNIKISVINIKNNKTNDDKFNYILFQKMS